MLLTGRVALVTGAARGIGRATALVLAEEGADVGVVDVLPEVEATAEAIRTAGRRSAAAVFDIADPAEVREGVESLVQALGPIDVLVNNAGIYVNKPVEAFTEREYDAVMGVNMKGTFLCTKFVIPSMVRRRRGAIVNVASDSGLVGTAGSSVYCASKGAMVLFTMAVALDHAKDGIRVNAICPGEVETPMLERDAKGSGLGYETYLKRLTEPIPMRRAARPEEIARGILFLASDESSFMTGAAMSVDGGATAR